MGYFTKRNLKRNANIKVFGLWKLKPLKFAHFFKKYYYGFFFAKESISFHIFKKLNIPQIEFALTTSCTLKCKNCCNYIPYIKKEDALTTSFEEFKSQLDNLFISRGRGINRIYNLILLGGEPLLVKDLPLIVDYAAKNKKISNIWIISNGTIIPNEKLICAMKKHNKKINFRISNYLSNEKLKNVLKHDEIIKKLKENNIQYYYDAKTEWEYVTEKIEKTNRTKEKNKKYYLKCQHPCISVLNGNVFACPRAGTFYRMHLYEFAPDEEISLNKPDKNLKKKFIDLYSKTCFSACAYCTMIEDSLKNNVIPALQMEDK